MTTKIEATLEELEEKLISYESFKTVLQQYMQRLLGSDQDTLSVVAEMLDAVKALSAARELAETPPDLHRVVELKEDSLYRYGGLAEVEHVDAPPLLDGGIIKLDDPQVYGMSLICTWLDCIVSNPEQSLDSLRKVFLKATDAWGIELNHIFRIDIGRMQPIVHPDLWLADLMGERKVPTLQLARVLNIAQALDIEAAQPIGQVPLPIWKHLLQTRPVYDLSTRFSRPGTQSTPTRLIALQRGDGIEKERVPCLYRIGTELASPQASPPEIDLADLARKLECSLVDRVRLEMIEKAAHLQGTTPPIFSANLPLGQILDSFALTLNQPPMTIMQDITPPGGLPGQRLLRVASSTEPNRVVQVFRIVKLASEEWPGQQDWMRIYRFYDLADIGVSTCPADAYLEVALQDNGDALDDESRSKVYFHRWGESRASLHITARGLRRAAQTGTLILLGADEETARDILDALQGLIGPAAQEIEAVISRLECQVRWRARIGEELFKSENT